MSSRRAISVSLPLLPLFDAPARDGIGLGHGFVDLGDRVIAVTPPGAPRMPNGIECEISVPRGTRVRVGAGRLQIEDRAIVPWATWDPMPAPRVRFTTDVTLVPDPILLAGRGPGLTPAGDDILAGYAAGLVLFAHRVDEAREIVERAAPRTTLLSATLLRHAARGELAEPAHSLLEDGDPLPLLAFGHTSGRAILLGLALAGGRRCLPDGPAEEDLRSAVRRSGGVRWLNGVTG